MNQMEQEAVRKCLENQDLVNKTKVSKLFKVMLSNMVIMSEVILICLFSKNNFEVPTFFVKKIKNNDISILLNLFPSQKTSLDGNITLFLPRRDIQSDVSRGEF